ncbi:MAG: TM1812 family CRISPR-associated protein [Spirochaetales bacterium]|nr:TM1812 family CRISPR-associated protein [Spirochaetales bacterium]MDY5914562.1 TM1812 family CRISPR-associated protein [Treponema sp.]
MDKVIFVTLMMADKMEKRHFPVENDSLTEYSGETYYAINSVFSNSIEKGDNIKVVLLETNAGAQAGKKNAQLFIDELNSFNTAGANISYEIITSEFINDKAKYKELYKKLVNNFTEGAELYADITFGIKTLPILILNAMQFGEKFFDCTIGNVIYLKTEFKDGVIVDGSQCIFDLTPLYMLSTFTNNIECSSGERAIAALDALFEE